MPGSDTPEQFNAFTLSEFERWGKLIREAGIPMAQRTFIRAMPHLQEWLWERLAQ